MRRWTNGLPGATQRLGAMMTHRGLSGSKPWMRADTHPGPEHNRSTSEAEYIDAALTFALSELHLAPHGRAIHMARPGEWRPGDELLERGYQRQYRQHALAFPLSNGVTLELNTAADRAKPSRLSPYALARLRAKPAAAQRWKQWVGASITGEKTPPSKAGEVRPRCIASTMPTSSSNTMRQVRVLAARIAAKSAPVPASPT